MTTNRRLAAIMMADVVGYSRMMEQDEAGTLAALKERRKAVLEPVVKAHGGRIVKVMGDGVLVEFGSAVNAVQGAIELQKQMLEANNRLPDDRHIVLRIGINLGDVIGEGSDIYGDGVNIAARLEPLAGAGGICISRSIYEQAAKRIDVEFEDLGEQMLKNLSVPVHAYKLAGRRPQAKAARVETTKPSIAVLPFDNLSGDPGQEYFSDGITEDIITELSRFRSLFVIARNSSFIYKGKPVQIQTVANELGVQFIVEGSVRRLGPRIRITAQLISTATGNHVWAERYDRPVDDLFSVQDDVVKSIVATAEGRLAKAAVESTGTRPTAKIDAYQLVLRARQCLGGYDVGTAEPMLREAIAIEPYYAQAHAWLCMAHWVKFFDDHAPETIEEAVKWGRKAVFLDDTDSTNHFQLGFAYLFQRQFDLADIHSQRALEINPADMLALSGRAQWLCRVGRHDEALQTLDVVARHDPFPPNWYWENRSIVLLSGRRFEEAIDAIMRKNQRFWWDHCYLGACLAQLGRHQEAQLQTAESLRQMPGASVGKLMRGEPYRRQEDADLLADGLRKAGLPE